ncbi:hypothetical protein SmJEL517_g00107 [Synchytrium microbalum]|uniref:Ubiquitin-like domain-containing protein n=1 Tax=Synchytrium microbalum TaxID=1806994 RepID=A0A507CJT0_9FUNG|nr:uncharacterized protein SmJEL517_g00107 [Synchytrium microbalum]TPX38105.1 hypothetical protein SmJEL517_g00107 [Synchytrium microbalum]
MELDKKTEEAAGIVEVSNVKAGVGEIEGRGIQPVPFETRHHTATYESFTLWFSANCCISTFVIGVLSQTIFYLGFWDSFCIILFFNALALLPPAYFTTWGPKTGMRQMVLTRYAFGYFGTYTILALNIFACIGWSAVNVVVGGTVVHAISDKVPVWVGIIIIAVITTLVALFGYKWIHIYEKFAWIPILVIFFIMLAEAAPYFSYVPMSTSPAPILSFGGTVYGFAAGWTSYAADYNVNMPAESSARKNFLWAYLGLIIPLVCLETLGLAVGTALGANDAYAAGLDAASYGGLFSAILDPLGNAKYFLMVLLALSTVGNNIPNDYTLGLTVQVIGPFFEKVPRFIWTVVGAVVYIVIAVSIAGKFDSNLEGFLLLIAYWLAPYSVIMAIEHLYIRKGNFANWDLTAWDTVAKLPLGLAANAALVAGIIGGVIGMAQVYYIGVLALKLDPMYGGDIGFELALGFSAIVYFILRPIEFRLATTSAVRVKRQKTTYFISTAPSSSIAELKQELAKIIGVSNVANIRLHVAGKAPGTYNLVDDVATLDQLAVADDGVLYMALPLSGTEAPDAKWEQIEVYIILFNYNASMGQH